jgi:hypothetical protein
MTKPDASDQEQETELKHMAEDVFSSEKREDIWALIIAMGVLILSAAFPDQIYHFFKEGLYLF